MVVVLLLDPVVDLERVVAVLMGLGWSWSLELPGLGTAWRLRLLSERL